MHYTRRGSTPRPGRVPYVWVQDNTTGHRFDVPENRIGPGMTPVNGYPKNWSDHVRRTKYRAEPPTPPPTQIDPPPRPPADTPEEVAAPPARPAKAVAQRTRKETKP